MKKVKIQILFVAVLLGHAVSMHGMMQQGARLRPGLTRGPIRIKTPQPQVPKPEPIVIAMPPQPGEPSGEDVGKKSTSFSPFDLRKKEFMLPAYSSENTELGQKLHRWWRSLWSGVQPASKPVNLSSVGTTSSPFGRGGQKRSYTTQQGQNAQYTYRVKAKAKVSTDETSWWSLFLGGQAFYQSRDTMFTELRSFFEQVALKRKSLHKTSINHNSNYLKNNFSDVLSEEKDGYTIAGESLLLLKFFVTSALDQAKSSNSFDLASLEPILQQCFAIGRLVKKRSSADEQEAQEIVKLLFEYLLSNYKNNELLMPIMDITVIYKIIGAMEKPFIDIKLGPIGAHGTWISESSIDDMREILKQLQLSDDATIIDVKERERSISKEEQQGINQLYTAFHEMLYTIDRYSNDKFNSVTNKLRSIRGLRDSEFEYLKVPLNRNPKRKGCIFFSPEEQKREQQRQQQEQARQQQQQQQQQQRQQQQQKQSGGSIYALLGISELSSTVQVKQAYRKFVKANHPDITKSLAEQKKITHAEAQRREKMLKEVNNAYDVYKEMQHKYSTRE